MVKLQCLEMLTCDCLKALPFLFSPVKWYYAQYVATESSPLLAVFTTSLEIPKASTFIKQRATFHFSCRIENVG